MGNCSYCGDEQEMEPEHVVPRAIFVNKNQSSIIIPACHKCNNDKSSGEDDLRDFLVIKVGIHGHPDIFPLMLEMAESAKKGFSKIGRAATEDRRKHLSRTNSGLYIPDYEIPIYDPISMDRTLRYIVRGLYFLEYGKPFLKDHPLSLLTVSDEEFDSTIHYFGGAARRSPREPMGNEVFSWVPAPTKEDPNVVGWLMVFFGRVAFIGVTGMADEKDQFELTFHQLIRRKGRRERKLKDIIDRGMIVAPPDDLLGFLRSSERIERK